jgi:hypothetical protein
MLIATTALSSGSDDYVVGVSVASKALSDLQAKKPGALPSIVYVFASINFDHAVVLKGIRSVIGEDVRIVGSSTAGEITGDGPAVRPSVAVLFLHSEVAHFASAVADDVSTNSHKAGADVALSLLQSSPETLNFVMMFADGLKGNGTEVLRGLVSHLGDKFPIVGGSSGDNGHFVETKQIYNNQVHTDSVVGVGVSGPVLFSVGVNHGWSAVGAPRTVTHAEGTVIRTIDNKSALSLYSEYLGEEEIINLKSVTLGNVALSYPLGIKDQESGEMLLRAPFAVEPDGSIVCGGEVKTGATVQLMIGTKDDAIAAARRAAETALAGLGKKPEVAFIFSCHVRNTLYDNIEAAGEEIRVMQEVIGTDVPLIGFYTYAEQAPVGGVSHNIRNCNAEFHNETIVLVLMAEM